MKTVDICVKMECALVPFPIEERNTQIGKELNRERLKPGQKWVEPLYDGMAKGEKALKNQDFLRRCRNK